MVKQPHPEKTRVKVYAAGTLRNGTVLQSRRVAGLYEVFVQFDRPGGEREWMPQSECFAAEDVPALIDKLRMDAALLAGQADKLEEWLERQSIQAG